MNRFLAAGLILLFVLWLSYQLVAASAWVVA